MDTFLTITFELTDIKLENSVQSAKYIFGKWYSLSMTFKLQLLQILFCVSRFRNRPFSMAKSCDDVLNLLKAIRNLASFMKSRYFSNQMYVYINSVSKRLELFIDEYQVW